MKKVINKIRDYINRPLLEEIQEVKEKNDQLNKNLIFLINQLVDIEEVGRLPSVEVVQNKQFNILKRYNEFMQKIGAEYFLFFGSLIGAVRHKGFVPWDDDIDTAMLHEDFKIIIKNENLLKEYGLGLSSPYTRENNFKFIGWHKIYDLQNNYHISIFLMDIVNESNPSNLKNVLSKYSDVAMRINYEFKKNMISFETMQKRINNLNADYLNQFDFRTRKSADKDSYIIRNITNFGSVKFTKFKYLYPIKFTQFSMDDSNSKLFPIPRNPNKILESYYGKDYMSFPSKIFPLHPHNHIEK